MGRWVRALCLPHPAQARPRLEPAPPGPTLCLRKPSHISWKAFLCSCVWGKGFRLHVLLPSQVLPRPLQAAWGLLAPRVL